jgi:glycosyltransferase involved in cell wall biosynthesis
MGRDRPIAEGEAAGWKPVLGLSDESDMQVAVPGRWGWAVGTVYDQPEPTELLELTVIVPARNEQDCLPACIHSLVAQSEDIFALGVDWELLVVDDHSTDRTRSIAEELAAGSPGVTVLQAPKLDKGWTGKASAIWTAAKRARGRWLLFTDADTIHEQGDLRRAIHEAARHKAGMLSYSPRQIVFGPAQRSLMPLVFCELALAYPPSKVSDPNQRIAAANGQFLLVEREAYRRLGGHASVKDKVLEDVALAFQAKRRKVGLRFRYAEDAVSTQMYRSTAAMIEGWTKNLALLFDNALALALWRALDRVVERALCRALRPVAGRWLGAGPAVGAHRRSLLYAGRQVEFSAHGLPACAAGLAVVCRTPLQKLVSASNPEAGKLEGTGIRRVAGLAQAISLGSFA